MTGLWTPDPATIVKARSVGAAGTDMGDVTDSLSVARFGMSIPWVLAFLRLPFAGGSGVADIDIVLDSNYSESHDVVLDTIPDIGTGRDAVWWVNPGEFHAWHFDAHDQIVLQWSSPHASMTWAMEAGFAPLNV